MQASKLIRVIQQHHDEYTSAGDNPGQASDSNSEQHGDDAQQTSHLGLEIRSVNNMISRYLNATMPESARTATEGNARIIMFLSKNQHRDIFQYDIEKRCSITPSTASRVLSLMEEKGLIERQAVERDARLRRIVLTDAAQGIVDALRRNATRMEETLFAGFTMQDQQRLSSYLALMKKNLVNTGLVGVTCAGVKNPKKPADDCAENNGNRQVTQHGRSAQ
jgi:DNA-binding MarR family transcriptional regulator